MKAWRSTLTAFTLAILFWAGGEARAGYVYVGSWDLATIGGGYSDPTNPWIWSNNPAVLSAVEAAALLFGGDPSDYAISTIDSDPANINNLAFVDGWGDTQYLFNPQSETFKLGTFYDESGTFQSTYSAYVVDHAPGFGAGLFINHAFRLQAIPEPSTIVMAGVAGIVGLAAASRRKRHGRLNAA